ncbi:MAG TPA: murein biosynthesis integral membrane protein MurJ [Candidatus Limnocylindrales bacterium]|nr:murein biosynthesis integral membrane protein MurJ [Candidatus Limnocylindrales bacterium]
MDEADTIDVGPAPETRPNPAEDAVEDPARPGSSRTRALARAGITVTALFLLSRILGYLRYVVIANAVPDPSQLDSFFAAFRIPDFLFQLVAAGALSSALIPVIAGLFATEQEARAWRVVSTVTTLMLSALLLLAGVVLLFAPQLVAFITPGFDAQELALTTELTRIMVLSPLFLAAGAVATSALNARGRFGAAAVAPLVYNIAIIVGAIVLVPILGINGLALSVVLGAAGHVLVQLPSLARIGARIRPRLELGDAEARKALVLMAPRALGLGATQVVFLVMTGLASTLAEGSIAVFNFAFAVLQIPIGVIGVPLGVVLLPSLSREAATGGMEAFRRLLVRGMSMLGLVMIAIAALGIVVSEDVTRLLFDYGSIGDSALELTATTLAVFLVGLTAHSLIAVVARAFYALQDTATPVVAALLAVVINIAAANALVGAYGVAGLAAAIAIAAWLELLALVVLLGRRVPGLDLGHVAVVMTKALIASIAGGVVAWLVYEALLGAWGQDPGFLLLLVRTTVTTICGGVVILGASAALRIEELRTIVELVLDLLRRKGRA